MRYRYVAHHHEHHCSSDHGEDFDAPDDAAAGSVGARMWDGDVARARQLARYAWCSVHVDAQVWREGSRGEPWDALVAEWHLEAHPPEPLCRPPAGDHLWREAWFEAVNEVTAPLRAQEACIRCGTVRVRDATRPVHEDCEPELRYEPYELEGPVLARTSEAVVVIDDETGSWRLRSVGMRDVLLGTGGDVEAALERANRLFREAGREVVAGWRRNGEGDGWVAEVFGQRLLPLGGGR